LNSGRDLFTFAVTESVEARAYITGRDFAGRPLLALPFSEDVRAVYQDLQITFWRDVRSRTNASPQLRAIILRQQQIDYSQGTKESLASYLGDCVAEAKAKGIDEISILELGCANGPTIRHMRNFFPEIKVRFFGIELTDFLVDNLLVRHPEARAIPGGVDEFLAMSAEDFGVQSFDLFLASGVLCQVPPDAAAKTLAHASRFCDQVLMWDYLLNMGGQISDSDPIIFKLAEDSQHILFLNPYEKMLRDAGFTQIDVTPTAVSSTTQGPGEGSVRARKPSTVD